MPSHSQPHAPEHSALDAYIKLMRASESVTSRVHVALPEDLTVTQFAVLEALHHLGPLCHRALADKVLKSSGNLTLVIKNLEKHGWISRERQADDQRYVKVHLTTKGQALISSLFPKVAAAITHEFDVLNEAERTTLGALCKKLGLGRVARPADS